MAGPSSATTPPVARMRNEVASSSYAMRPRVSGITSPRSERTRITACESMWRSTFRISTHSVLSPSTAATGTFVFIRVGATTENALPPADVQTANANAPHVPAIGARRRG